MAWALEFRRQTTQARQTQARGSNLDAIVRNVGHILDVYLDSVRAFIVY